MSQDHPATSRHTAAFHTVPVCGLPVAVLDYRMAVGQILNWARSRKAVYAVEAANTHVAALSRSDEDFGSAMERFDLICPDGMPLVWAANRRIPGSCRMEDRVYGPTLMLRTIEGSREDPEIRHFFLGGRESTLRKLEERFSDSQVAGTYSPPFGEWPPDEFDRICRIIGEAKANIIWVGLGCPKQEKWIAEHKDRLPPGVYLGVGAAFAFHAGEVPQAPAFLQSIGMEWFYRLLMEPRRLFMRYTINNSRFIKYWVADFLKEEQRLLPWDNGSSPSVQPGSGSRDEPPHGHSEMPPPTTPVGETDPPLRINVLGVGISALTMKLAVEKATQAAARPGFTGYVTVTGVHGVMESQRDDELRRIHNRSYLTTPDGMSMVWMAWWFGYSFVERVYGPDLMLEIFDISEDGGQRHFLFGAAEGVAQDLAVKLKERFPRAAIVGTVTPPYRELTEEEDRALVAELQEKKPHFFWVGLSTPKQELFMHAFLSRHPDLTEGWDHGMLMLGVGAAFDFHAGRIRQAPRWMQRNGLEWFFRLCMEPRRLWKRYLTNNTGFIMKILPQVMEHRHYRMEK